MTCIKEAFVDVWPPRHLSMFGRQGEEIFAYQLENDFITSF